jgi:hypothetical protein
LQNVILLRDDDKPQEVGGSLDDGDDRRVGLAHGRLAVYMHDAVACKGNLMQELRLNFVVVDSD